MTVDEIVAKVIKDKPFFDNSGGGVTISGGEPTLSMVFLSRLIIACKAEGIHTLLETCGQFNLKKFMDFVYPHLDLIYFDIKIFENNEHRRLCGVGNNVILENFTSLYSLYLEGGVEILPRIPVIPGMTDAEENINAIASFLKELNVKKAELMPYHPLWQEKNLKIGMENPAVNDKTMLGWMSQDGLNECKSIFKKASIDV